VPTRANSQGPSPSANPFVGSPNPPEPAELREVLGRSFTAWDGLRARICEDYGQVVEEWAVPAKKYGWSLRLKLKKRTILHLGPRLKHFTVAIILGEKAVAALRESDLAPEVISMVDQSKRYTEGRVIRFEIRSKRETAVVEALAKFKMEN
jgi:hypothetical protein